MIDKLLFLDIDGVLTSDQSGTSYHCEDPEAYKPDEECKANLLRVAAAVPNLKVVLHSAWTTRVQDDCPCFDYRGKTFYSPLNNVVGWLIEYDLFLGLTDCTKRDADGKRISKKEKILEWLQEHSRELDSGCKALVIDDDTVFNDLVTINTMEPPGIASLRFMPIDKNTGFTQEDAAKAIGYFNGQQGTRQA